MPKSPDYSGTSLPQTLGITSGNRVALVRVPKDFGATLGPLPGGVTTTARLEGQLDVVVLFCRAGAEVRSSFAAAAKCLALRGGLWVAWPKKASGVLTDLDENKVRAFGLEQGLVDNKVCAIDEIWSGLRGPRPAAAPHRHLSGYYRA